ncbi:MAG TPA: iron-containing alcohol dehydrogenase [Kiritimatiellia bacterium]|nr:iron-containing alcohol dehydrogenase [Kiritimatiellia bacterium]
MNFEFATATRIVLGTGRAAELPALAAEFGTRIALVTGASRRFEDRVEHVCVIPIAGEPSFDAIRAGVDAARAARADTVVAIGGGSVLDAGKAIAMLLANGGDPLDYAELIGAGKPITRPSMPFIAVPTTAGTGSEATRNAVLFSAEHQLKVSLRSAHMLPRIALVDPELALALPPAQTAASGMDALAQLIEPFLSRRANPMTDALCHDGISRAARALPRAFADGGNLAARTELSLAALYSGIALANAGLGAVHGLAGPIGGLFNAPHGAVCAALLPGVFEENFLQTLEAGKNDYKDHPQTLLAPGGLAPPEPKFASLPRSQGTYAPATQGRGGRRQGFELVATGAVKFAEVARLLTGRSDATPEDAVRWLRELRTQLGIPGLAAYGIREEHAADIARKAQAASSMKGNPVALSDEVLARVVVEAL